MTCRAAPYREPRKLPFSLQPAWRFPSMHLKSYPKVPKKELQLEANHENTRDLHTSQEGARKAEDDMCRQCTLGGALSGTVVSRRPFGVISTNTLLASKAAVEPPWHGKTSSVKVLSRSLLLSPMSGGGLNPGQDGEGLLDIWAVIKPGNTKEKIAVYTAQQCEPSTQSFRAVSMKVKGCWEVEGSIAKRRKWSANQDRQQGSVTRLPPNNGKGPSSAGSREQGCREGDGEEGGKALSVVEIVAYFDQQGACSKPCSLRSSGNSPLSTVGLAPPLGQPGGQNTPETRAEEGEGIRVLDMVAKLESECLKVQSEREAGSLKRSSSLRRSTGPSLLVGGDAQPVTAQEPCFPGPVEPSALGNASAEPAGTAHGVDFQRADRERQLRGGEGQQEGTSCPGQRREPLPGRLFFSSIPQPALSPTTTKVSRARISSCGVEEERQGTVEVYGGTIGPEHCPSPLRRTVSHEFLEMRFKIQLLLEPQQYMAILPHHIMVKIFGLLPTETLAALKCTCHYFKFIIESYSVRPADSRWVCDPRYRDDPCKQCKKRYGRGDVSLCRWHHKPYCQALPYGPGYWMCCHGTRKDAPGCNVGLHDNHWVPAFHSLNMPLYRKARDAEEDA